jgi:hypothetical protein
VYVGKRKGPFVKIIPRERVSQVDVLEDERILLVLAEKQLFAYGLEALDPNDPNSASKRAKKLGSSVSFFKTGVCQNRTLVGIVKNSSNALDQNSTIKTLEPIEQDGSKKNKSSFRSMLRGGNTELFKLYKVWVLTGQLAVAKHIIYVLVHSILLSLLTTDRIRLLGLLYSTRDQLFTLFEEHTLRWL